MSAEVFLSPRDLLSLAHATAAIFEERGIVGTILPEIGKRPAIAVLNPRFSA